MISEVLLEMTSSGVLSLIDYLTAHVLLCLVPAFFLSGAFNALISSSTIFKYMGYSISPVKKGIAYIFAATSGLIIEVCSCTILPLFAGIWKKGAGFGPAIAFLFAGPGITLLSTPLTASVLGIQFAVVKLVISILMAIGVGLAMEFSYREMRSYEGEEGPFVAELDTNTNRKTYQAVLFFSSLILIMVSGTAPINLTSKIIWVGVFTVLTVFFAHRYYTSDELKVWMHETYNFIKLIFPVLLLGVFLSGAIKPLIPRELVASLAGQNTLVANIIGALFGLVTYFPTLLEVPVAETFLELGMHQGPLMSYLLVDPAVSLQTLLVVNAIIKPKKTVTYAVYMMMFGILAGYIYGMFV
jgi:hypothetical protein